MVIFHSYVSLPEGNPGNDHLATAWFLAATHLADSALAGGLRRQTQPYPDRHRLL